MIIKVTQQNINDGIVNRANGDTRCTTCPVALAISDVCELQEDEVIRVCKPRARKIAIRSPIDLLGTSISVANFPEEVSRFIQSFDDGYIVEPIDFEIHWKEVVT